MSNDHILYFAYGSNLLRQRLTARCPGIDFVERANLPGYRLTFNQRSQDGSGKGAMEAAISHTLPGVLWRLPRTELDALDAAEGAGHAYERQWVDVITSSGEELSALTYRPLQLHGQPQPFDWYLALVIAGAIQAALPQPHIEALYQVSCQPDNRPLTTGGDLGKAALKAASMLNILDQLQVTTA